MGVKGFGYRVHGTYRTPILDVDEEGMSDTKEIFPAPGVIFSEDVHTNSDGLRVVIKRKYLNYDTSILIWSDDLDKMYSIALTLAPLRRRLSRNKEALTKEFTSWIAEKVT